ncbi:protein YhfH [Ectobacillus panaciterrae]|uniref:protein YhfH n=1 Tax=Ectobacillus panaciterrae TaxID=363872 RepID=UPI001FE096B3|nr:protein YhfH [Ectobacillus panaciterrae]
MISKGAFDIEDLDFYKNISIKVCSGCGWKMDEQHESYLHMCEHCREIIDEQ